MAKAGFLAQDLPSEDESDEDYNPLKDKVRERVELGGATRRIARFSGARAATAVSACADEPRARGAAEASQAGSPRRRSACGGR